MALPFEWRKSSIFLGVELAKASIRQVAAGHRTIVLIGGGASTGKTYLTRQICRQHRIKEVPEDRPDNAEALVSMTWRHRELPVHVLNECDHILRNERSMNVLKLMHEEPRRCSLYTKEARRNEEYLEIGSRQYRESIAPTTFDLDNLCRHILTSNLNYQSEEVTCQLPKEHWLALLRRGIDPIYIETGGNDGLDLFQYTVGLATEGQMLRSHQVDYATARDAVAFFIQNVNHLVDITPARLMMIAAAIRDAGADQARRNQRLGLMLRQTDQRPRLQLEQSMVQALLWPRKPPKPKKRHDARQRPRETPQADTSAPTPPDLATEQPEPSEQPPAPVQDAVVVPFPSRTERQDEPPPDPDPPAARQPDPTVPDPAVPDPQPDPDLAPVIVETAPDPVPPEQPQTAFDAVGAIEDAVLPVNLDDRIGAFFGAIAQIEATPHAPGLVAYRKGAGFIRDVIANDPAARMRLFAKTTVRGILNEVGLMDLERYSKTNKHVPLGSVAPNPPPPPPEAIDTQAPESQTELPLAVLVPPELTFGQAIRAVYALDEPTCDRVADVLCRLPLEGCNDDELSELARALECCSEWYAEHVQSICHTFARYAGTLLFCTGDEVLVWEGSEKGFQIYQWDAVRKMMAPHVAEEERRLDAQLRRRDTQALLTKKLPAKRKLKAAKERIDRIIELKAAGFTEKAQRAIDHIRQMTDDDPRFSECTKLEQYIDAVVEYLEQPTSSYQEKPRF